MLNPCKYCGVKYQVSTPNAPFKYMCRFCSNCTGLHETLEKAAAAWNAANPVNVAENRPNAALEAVQQALAWSLMYRYAINHAVWRNDIHNHHDLDSLDLLISQGVLVEIDGRITIKGV